MATFQENLNIIETAILGSEMRDAIHDAIEEAYNGSVRADIQQSLTEEQKTQARANIEASKGSAIAPDHRYVAFTLTAGSYALHEGELYRALVDIPAGETWTPAHWEKTEVGYTLKTLGDQIADLNYTPISIASFAISSPANGMAEIGSTVSTLSFGWTLTGTPVSQTLDNIEINVISRSASLSQLALISDSDFALVVTDAGSPSHAAVTAQKTATLHFYNNIHYGAAALGTINGAFVNGLPSKVLTGSKGRTITVNAGSNQYIWYALPKRLGSCSFNVGGFDGGFEAPQTVSVANSSEYIEDYYVYRSTNASLGNTTVKVS